MALASSTSLLAWRNSLDPLSIVLGLYSYKALVTRYYRILWERVKYTSYSTITFSKRNSNNLGKFQIHLLGPTYLCDGGRWEQRKPAG